MGWKAAHSLNDWVTPCVPLKLHDWAEVQFMWMPQGARHGKTRAKLRTACLWHQGIVWEQGFWKVSSDTKRTGGSATDQMTSLFQPRTFVKNVLRSFFLWLNPFHLGFLLLSLIPSGGTAQQKKKGGQTVSLQNLKLINAPVSSKRKSNSLETHKCLRV